MSLRLRTSRMLIASLSPSTSGPHHHHLSETIDVQHLYPPGTSLTHLGSLQGRADLRSSEWDRYCTKTSPQSRKKPSAARNFRTRGSFESQWYPALPLSPSVWEKQKWVPALKPCQWSCEWKGLEKVQSTLLLGWEVDGKEFGQVFNPSSML